MEKIFTKHSKEPEIKIVVNGFYDAGKTTLLYKLKRNEIKTTVPTFGIEIETVKHKNMEIISFDVGGRVNARPFIRFYVKKADAVIFVVDSTDPDRLEEAKREFDRRILTDDMYDDAIFVIAANKQDVKGGMSVFRVQDIFEVHKLRKTRTCEVFPVSAATGEGLWEMMDWVTQTLKMKQEKKKQKESAEKLGENSFFNSAGKFIKGLFLKL